MITVSIETATKLHNAGRGKFGTGYTKFSYRPYHSNEVQLINQFHPFLHYCVIHGENFFYAPTAQEILDRLLIYLDTKSNDYGQQILMMEGTAGKRGAYYYDLIKQVNVVGPFIGDSLADALAMLWIYCKEKNLLPEQK